MLSPHVILSSGRDIAFQLAVRTPTGLKSEQSRYTFSSEAAEGAVPSAFNNTFDPRTAGDNPNIHGVALLMLMSRLTPTCFARCQPIIRGEKAGQKKEKETKKEREEGLRTIQLPHSSVLSR
jgi:hypothetical protein